MSQITSLLRGLKKAKGSYWDHFKGLWVYVDSLYSTYLVVQIRLSYDDSIYLVIEIMTYDKEFFMKDKKKEEKVKIHVQR